MRPRRDKYPDVPVEIVLTHDSAVFALVEVSRPAQLVVVGAAGAVPSAGSCPAPPSYRCCTTRTAPS